MGADGTLFGIPGGQITYAALSLDGSGLISYGPVTLLLKDEAINHRASLLEENSFKLLGRFSKIPKGYRAIWAKRADLAIAKLLRQECVEKTRGATSRDARAKLILYQVGNRATDEFIEVHLWRGFNFHAIESICSDGIPPVSDEDIALLKLGKSWALKRGIPWI